MHLNWPATWTNSCGVNASAKQKLMPLETFASTFRNNIPFNLVCLVCFSQLMHHVTLFIFNTPFNQLSIYLLINNLMHNYSVLSLQLL